MPHDATKVLLGTSPSSIKEVISHQAVAATFPAGTAVRLKSDDTISVTKADGRLIGVSLGQDMADTNNIAIAVSGMRIPILLTDDEADYAYVVLGASVYVDDVTGKANIVDDGDVTTTITNAIYVSGALDGVDESGASVKVALIDMIGGL